MCRPCLSVTVNTTFTSLVPILNRASSSCPAALWSEGFWACCPVPPAPGAGGGEVVWASPAFEAAVEAGVESTVDDCAATHTAESARRTIPTALGPNSLIVLSSTIWQKHYIRQCIPFR